VSVKKEMSILLETKLQIPQYNHPLIDRATLLSRLDEAPQYKLTLLSAAAGYGKSTLLSNWCARRKESILWIALDRGDNDTNRFLTYLAAVVRALDAQLARDLIEMLQAPQPMSTEEFLSNWIFQVSQSTKPVFLILDDYHLVEDIRVHQALNYLLAYMPDHLHLIISSREDPPLPLAKLRAKRQLLEIRAAELSFSALEMDELLWKNGLKKLTLNQRSSLWQRTEGWITGLQMALLSLQNHPNPDEFLALFSGNHQHILDYLMEEVLSDLEEDQRLFLFQTSVLQRLNPALCDAVCERQNSSELLAWLTRTNHFLIPLDKANQWFRYHHLFADLLQARAAGQDAQMLSSAHLRASRWYAHQEEWDAALYHAAQAEDWEWAGQLVAENGAQKLYHGELLTLQHWLELLPNQLRRQNSWLCTLAAWTYLLTGDFNQCMDYVQQAILILTDYADNAFQTTIQGHLSAIQAYGAAFSQNSAESLSFAQRALQFLPSRETAIRSVVAFTQAAGAMLQDNLDLALSFAEQAAQAGQHSNRHVAIPALGIAGSLLQNRGQLHQAEEKFNAILAWCMREDGTFSPLAARGFSGLCGLYLQYNRLEEAYKAAKQSVELARRWGSQDTWMSSNLHLVNCLAAQGEVTLAEKILDEVQGKQYTTNVSPGLIEFLQETRVNLWLAQGDSQHAVLWAKEILPVMTRVENSLQIPLWRAVIQALLTRSDSTVLALPLIEKLNDYATRQYQELTLISALIFRSAYLLSIGNELAGRKCLLEAMELAEHKNYIRVFLQSGSPVKRILQNIAEKELHPFAITICKFLPAAHTLIDSLSERELEILQLVEAGKTNQEIADLLCIALSTVKSHTNNIFSKLGVKNRTQALAKARALSLLKRE